jgi:hypothetical protein
VYEGEKNAENHEEVGVNPYDISVTTLLQNRTTFTRLIGTFRKSREISLYSRFSARKYSTQRPPQQYRQKCLALRPRAVGSG